jgi:hypothetical protein
MTRARVRARRFRHQITPPVNVNTTTTNPMTLTKIRQGSPQTIAMWTPLIQLVNVLPLLWPLSRSSAVPLATLSLFDASV